MYLLPIGVQTNEATFCFKGFEVYNYGFIRLTLGPFAKRMGSLPSLNFRVFVQLEMKERPLRCNALFHLLKLPSVTFLGPVTAKLTVLTCEEGC